MKFWFKHKDWGDDWEELPRSYLDPEQAAEALAEDHWNEDPSDPSEFLFIVEIKDEKGIVRTVVVEAEVSLSFYGRERTPQMKGEGQ